MAGKDFCRSARERVMSLCYKDKLPEYTPTRFFPMDRLRSYLSAEKVDEVLGCECNICLEDCRAIGNPAHIRPRTWGSKIIGDGENTKDTRRTALALFGLLIVVQHPILILGFLENSKNDYLLEVEPESFNKSALEKYFRTFASNHEARFETFASDFEMYFPQFAVRHMDSGTFSRYPVGTILPFINETEIGKQKDEDSYLTNIGANGRVFAFGIYSEYRKFNCGHADNIERFARKTVDTSVFTEHLERANLESAQTYKHKHIVKLIKAYSLGGVMNLIFPLAQTNLDRLLRDHKYSRAISKGGHLETNGAWKQLLGIAEALSKISGSSDNLTPTGIPQDPTVKHWYGFHFDLKPANILISNDKTWLITDFGQSIFTLSSDRTPRVRNYGGTDAYAPPEFIDNENTEYSRKYDVWSLGCIALEVAAFVVLGYEGLNGSPSHIGLDQARRSQNGRRTDSRFYYRRSQTTAPELKPEIKNFMETLKRSERARGRRSQKFLCGILKVIERMLEPKVNARIPIKDVIRMFKVIILQTSSQDIVGQLGNTVAAANERTIGAPELGLIELRNWNASFQKWLDSALSVFEDKKGNLRFHNFAHNSLPIQTMAHRQKHDMLPYYAFWMHETPPADEYWLALSSLDPDGPSEVPGGIYGFDQPDNAHLVQSKLTYQKIEASFALDSVSVQKNVSFTRKFGRNVKRKVLSIFASKASAENESVAFFDDKEHLDGRDLRAATVQL